MWIYSCEKGKLYFTNRWRCFKQIIFNTQTNKKFECFLMALRRVLVLIQVSSLRSDRQAHAYQLNKSDKKRKCWQSITHFRFLLFCVKANLFHGVLDKSLWNEFFFWLVKTEKRFLCLHILFVRFSAFLYCVFISSLVKYFSRHKVAKKKEN